MANEKKTSRKKFRVAVSGSTVDGREISPVHLREAAENFNPDVYAARVNVEHYLSPCPSSEFSAMGDVTALSTEDITEPRIALDAIDVVWKAGGRAGVTLSGTVMQTMQNVELTITLRE
ncbi:GPO family capsid scaffolding protein [Escherichia coli]|uniref:GPO family capsid scaffolding protein n=1 Tax=Escherichia coli TaxID=562 RepID=UPI001CBB10A3|nr:GPO family capsid scaffolding protein [Escherichia coli]